MRFISIGNYLKDDQKPKKGQLNQYDETNRKSGKWMQLDPQEEFRL